MVIKIFQTNLNLVWNLRLAKLIFFFPNQTGIGLENLNNIFLFQGLARHIDRFVEEEVEVRHNPHLSDGDLPDPLEVLEGTDTEETPDVNEEEGEREVL